MTTLDSLIDVGLFQRRLRVFALPAAVTAVIEMCDDPDIEFEDLAKRAERDPALTARLVQLSNSSLFARASQVCSVVEAVRFLGVNSVRMAAVSLCLAAVRAQERKKGLDLTNYWRHALASATCARELARDDDLVHPDEAFIAGLLMDIAYPMLLVLNLDGYIGKVVKPGDAHPDAVTELEYMGRSHAELTALALRYWGMPDRVSEGVVGHHLPELVVAPPVAARLCRLLSCAHGMAVCVNKGTIDLESDFELSRVWCTEAGRSRDELGPFLEHIERAIAEFAELFELPKG